MHEMWKNAGKAENSELKHLEETLPNVIDAAFADGTNRKYKGGWSKWLEWTKGKAGVQAIPSNPWHVALYLNHVLQNEGNKGAVHTAFYGIRWAHQIEVLSFPTEAPFVQLVLRGCERLTGKPTVKRDVFTADALKELFEEHDEEKGRKMRG